RPPGKDAARGRYQPGALNGDEGPRKLASLIRGYSKQGGHHAQFNVVDEAHQNEIIARMAYE
ncbi:MAG: hypothetical protein KKC64_09635, partial [Spirochaetes bacterium]|nr:hypothetical protein [Spirochaetota bacterium]